LVRKSIVAISRLFWNFDNVYEQDFDDCAQQYDSAQTRRSLARISEEVVNSLGIKPGMHCMDLGCGTGDVSILMARVMSNKGVVEGYDVSENMLAVAKKKSKGLSCIRYFREDMLSALKRSPDNLFDIVTCFWALGYSCPHKVLSQVYRVLKVGGRVGVLVNTQESLNQLQRIVIRIILRTPFILKGIPSINFPSNIKHFSSLVKRISFKPDTLKEESLSYFFSSSDEFILWLKTSGPSAGFRGALKPKYRDEVFNKIKAVVDENQGITLRFRYIRFIGIK